TRMQANPIYYAGVAFRVIHDNVVSAAEDVYQAHHSLISIVDQYGVFLIFECCQFFFELLMKTTVSAHHARAHREGKPICFSRFGIRFSYFGVIGKPQVVVEAPHDHFFSTEPHAVTDLPFQFWKGEISMCPFAMLA